MISDEQQPQPLILLLHTGMEERVRLRSRFSGAVGKDAQPAMKKGC